MHHHVPSHFNWILLYMTLWSFSFWQHLCSQNTHDEESICSMYISYRHLEFFVTCYLYFGTGNKIWCPVVNFVNDSPIYMQFVRLLKWKFLVGGMLIARTSWRHFARQPVMCKWCDSGILFVDLQRISQTTQTSTDCAWQNERQCFSLPVSSILHIAWL